MPRLFRHPPYTPIVTHAFPSLVWLPGSSYALEIFPGCLEVHGVLNGCFFLERPCQFIEHTTRLNLLDQSVTIEGMTPSGFQRLHIHKIQEGWVIEPKKNRLQCTWQQKTLILEKNQQFVFIAEKNCLLVELTKARLVLASPNASNWDTLLCKRMVASIVEQLYLVSSDECTTTRFLESDLQNLLFKGFRGVLVPRVGTDVCARWGRDFWPSDSFKTSLAELKVLLRSFFIREEREQLKLVSALPSYFPAGQLLDETAFDGAVRLSFDWRKGSVRRVLIMPQKDIQFSLCIPDAHSFRLRVLGNKVVTQEVLGQIRTFKKDKRYLLDNFVQ